MCRDRLRSLAGSLALVASAALVLAGCGGGGGGAASGTCVRTCEHVKRLCGTSVGPWFEYEECLADCDRIAAGTMECTGHEAAERCALAATSCQDLQSSCSHQVVSCSEMGTPQPYDVWPLQDSSVTIDVPSTPPADTGSASALDTGGGTTRDVAAPPGHDTGPALTPDVGTPPDDTDGPGSDFGAPCEANADCESGLCLPFCDGALFCSVMCLDTCPEGFECRAVMAMMPDVVYACLPFCEG